jgi:CRP-like cAMP-binding protein
VVALEDASLATLERDEFLTLVCEEPIIARNTLSHLTGLIRSLSDRVVEFSTLGVSNRIHSELLRLALATGARSGRVVLSPAPKQSDVANRVSTHREAVSRELALLQRHGLVERERRKLVIVDLDELRKLVTNVSRPSNS